MLSRNRYQDYKVFEIDITLELHKEEASVSPINSRPDALVDEGIPLTNRVSLGILRENVKPTGINNFQLLLKECTFETPEQTN